MKLARPALRRKSCHGCGCCSCCAAADADSLLSRRPEMAPDGWSYKYAENAYALDAPLKEDPEFDDAHMGIKYVFAAAWERDRGGDFLEIGPNEFGAGIVVENHKRNPVAYIDHGKDPWWTQPIGLDENPDDRSYTVELLPERGLAICKTYLSSSCPVADRVYAMYREHLLRGGSIGYRKRIARKLPPDLEAGYVKGLHLCEVELLETTLTAMPMNQDAVWKILDGETYKGMPIEFKSFIRRQAEPRPAWSPGWGAGKASGPAHKPPGPGGGQFTSGPGGSGGGGSGGGSKPRGGAASTSGSQAKKKAKRSEGKPSTRESSPAARKGAMRLAHAGMALARAGMGVAKPALDRLAKAMSHPAAAPLVNSWNAIHAVCLVGNNAMKGLAGRIAEEKNLPPERLASLTRTLTAIDLTFQGGAMVGFVAAESVHAHHLAIACKLASYVPVASTAYVVASGAQNPIKTAKLALSMLQEHFPDKIQGAAAFAWGAIRHPLQVQEHGAGHKAYEGDRLAEWGALVAEHLAAASDQDLWEALFAVAFDDVRDVAEAVRMADACLAAHDADPGDDQGQKSISPAMSSVDQSTGGVFRNAPVFLSRRRRLKRKGASMTTPATPPATPTGRKNTDGDPATPAPERIPHGAGVLADLHSCLALMGDIYKQEKDVLDNPDVRKAVDEIEEGRKSLAEKVRGHFSKHYPDLEELEEEESHDDDDGKNLRPDRRPVTPKSSAGGVVTPTVSVESKRLTKSDTETVREAAEFLDDHVERENLSPSGKAGCMYHSKSLRELTKDDDEEMSDEEGKALGTLLTKTLKRLDANEAQIKKALGT